MSGQVPSGAPAATAAAAATAASLSVVIPTHDTCQLTLSCLSALAAARPVAGEVIVVDDGSGDGTAEAVAASYPAARLLRHPQPRGFTAAVNAGAALAGGDLLLLLNSDTEVAPDALGALVDAFDEDPRLGVAGAALYYPDGQAQWSGGAAPRALWLLGLASGLPLRLAARPRWRRVRPVSGHRRREVEWVTGAALAVRRATWNEVGPLDPRFVLYAQDLDFCLRAAERGWKVAVVAASRVVHHHGATIGSAGGVTAARHHPALLWADLVRWRVKRGGPGAGRRAARLLSAGGVIQRLLLRLEGLRGGAAGQQAGRDRQALAAAAAAARAAAASPAPSLPASHERSRTR